jgi:hypothetical protein
MDNRRLRGFVSLAAIFTILLLVACGSSPTGVKPSGGGNTPASVQVTIPAKTGVSPSINAVALGSEAAVDDMSIVVTEIVSPADEIVAKGNKFNATLEPNSVFIMVNTTVTCKKAASEKCLLVGNEFKVIDSAGVFHRHVYTLGVDGIFIPGEFKGGAVLKGYLIFQVPVGDNKLVMRYSGNTGGEANLALYH